MEIWERPGYQRILDNEWFALGQIDPSKYKNRDEWVAALLHEREVKDYIYKLRNDDAEANKYYDKRNDIYKYNPGYMPMDWDEAQHLAISKLGKPDARYTYSPLSTPNIDDYYFNSKKADIWCEWLERSIMHVEGELSNCLILLTVEQRAFFRTIFGWIRKIDKYRRYREIFKYIPRKNSKTFDLAALALGTMFLDGEGGCKIVAVATSLDQARYAFNPARQIIIKDKELKICGGQMAKYFKHYKNSITAKSDSDTFKPIAFADGSAHGGNFAVSILDEVHEMEDDSMYMVCKTSQGARKQPLIVMITTAATAEENFCNRKLAQAKEICRLNDGEQDRFLPILYCSNPHEYGDDWKDTMVQLRVNPMLGIAKDFEYMKDIFGAAKNDARTESKFKRLDLNWITSSLVAAYDVVTFNRCQYKMRPKEYKMIWGQEVPKFLFNKKCYVGLDLAGKRDLCAITLDFPASNWVLSWSFTPEQNHGMKDIKRFEKRINFIGTDIIVFDELRQAFEDIMSNFKIIELGFDQAFATELIQILEKTKKIKTCQVTQTPKFLNEPIRMTIDDIAGEKIKHNGCPFFKWQIGNCQTKEDKFEQLMLTKSGSASPRKIDAVAAWVNARAIRLNKKDRKTLKERFDDTGSYF